MNYRHVPDINLYPGSGNLQPVAVCLENGGHGACHATYLVLCIPSVCTLLIPIANKPAHWNRKVTDHSFSMQTCTLEQPLFCSGQRLHSHNYWVPTQSNSFRHIGCEGALASQKHCWSCFLSLACGNSHGLSQRTCSTNIPYTSVL